MRHHDRESEVKGDQEASNTTRRFDSLLAVVMITGFIFAGFSIAMSGGSSAAPKLQSAARDQGTVVSPAPRALVAPLPSRSEQNRRAEFLGRVLPFVLFVGSGAKREWGRLFGAAEIAGEAPHGATRLTA